MDSHSEMDAGEFPEGDGCQFEHAHVIENGLPVPDMSFYFCGLLADDFWRTGAGLQLSYSDEGHVETQGIHGVAEAGLSDPELAQGGLLGAGGPLDAGTVFGQDFRAGLSIRGKYRKRGLIRLCVIV